MLTTVFLRIAVISALIVAVLAPFTFLVPETTTERVKEREKLTGQAKLEKAKQAKVQHKKINNQAKVVEEPLHNVDLPDFDSIYDIPTKKRRFFSFIRPAVVAKNNELAAQRASIEHWQEQLSLGLGLTDEEELALTKLIKAYRINEEASPLQQINDLLIRVDIIPTQLVLVQAANESAWGTSRFAQVGLNFFGIWCYRTGCGMVPGGRDTGAKHEVAAFQSVDAAVSGYFNNINKHNAYHVFRTIRAELRAQDQPLDPKILATGLLPYSERGIEYVLDITDMLRHNKRYFVKADNQTAATD